MTDTTTTATTAEADVRDAVRRWKTSFEAKDVDAMMTFYAPDGFTAFDLMPPLEFSGGPMWRENWASFFTAFDGPIQLDLSGLEIHTGGDLAFMRAFVRLRGVMYGDDLDTWVRQTNCFRLVDGEWLMIHDHVSWPTDFATGQSLMALVPDAG
ncbi:YybH family protein [Promicromonospora aerolata]|uniref:YybH family protein n=1 Tax=Promicromonospora aerolata TaxID=195749 RepID=A0ABW4V6W9_9MICO